MKNFENFIGIDWSGAKAPVLTNAIALAICEKGQGAPNLLRDKWSRETIYAYIQNLPAKTRTLIGIDANFGYAQEIGLKQFGPDYEFKTLWQAVENKSKDENFFAAGFWQAYPQYFWTHGQQPAHITLPKRRTEIACGQAGYGWPESPFKLLGPKQVGKGGLAAMRMAHHLKREMGDALCIWPFEREQADTARIVITEIYPRQFLRRAGHGPAKIRTLKALNHALTKLETNPIKDESYRFSDHDSDALISAAGLRFLCGNAGQIPDKITNPPLMDAASARREGWIFGT